LDLHVTLTAAHSQRINKILSI